MKKYLILSLLIIIPTLLKSQVAMEEIGDFRIIYGAEARKSIYQISYKGFKGEVGGTDGQFGGRVSPDYLYVEEKTKKGNLKYWKLGFKGRCNRKTGFTMKKGGKILLKLFDNSVISLVTHDVSIKEDYEYGTWFLPTAKLSNINYNKIIQVGVKK